MPRWNRLSIKGYRFYEDNVLSVFSDYKTFFNFKNQEQSIPNDIKLNYDGDVSFSSEDFDLVYNVESFIQRLYFYLITRKGYLPGDSTFGTHLEDLVGQTTKPNLNLVVRTLAKDLEGFEDIEYIEDIAASLVLSQDIYVVELNLILRVRGFKYRLFLDFEIF